MFGHTDFLKSYNYLNFSVLQLQQSNISLLMDKKWYGEIYKIELPTLSEKQINTF